MRRTFQVFFAISLLGIILVLCSACVLPRDERPVVDVGLSQIKTRETSTYISFDEVKLRFGSYYSVNRSADKTPVYYIHARDVDESGNAVSWIFGVRQANSSVLLIYDRTGWKINPWNSSLPKEKILLDQVVSPGALFIQNKKVIFNVSSSLNSERRDLVLKQGIYTLTTQSGNTSRTHMFNASTGVMISGNV